MLTLAQLSSAFHLHRTQFDPGPTPRATAHSCATVGEGAEEDRRGGVYRRAAEPREDHVGLRDDGGAQIVRLKKVRVGVVGLVDVWRGRRGVRRQSCNVVVIADLGRHHLGALLAGRAGVRNLEVNVRRRNVDSPARPKLLQDKDSSAGGAKLTDDLAAAATGVSPSTPARRQILYCALLQMATRSSPTKFEAARLPANHLLPALSVTTSAFQQVQTFSSEYSVQSVSANIRALTSVWSAAAQERENLR